MKLSFDINREDVAAFNLHYYDTDPALVKNRRQGRFALPALVVVFGLYCAVRQGGHWMYLVWFGGLALLWILIHPWLQRSGLNRQIEAELNNPDNENLFGGRTAELDDEKVALVTDKVHESMLWSLFIRALETPDHFFLYITRRQALIIPKRGLSAADVGELASLLAAHIPVYSKSENKKIKK